MALALAKPLAHVLHIHSVAMVVLALLSLSTALVFPLAMGILQGQQRFSDLATLYVLPWLVRLVVLAIAAAAGYRLGGAVFATLAGAVAATVLALVLIREPLRGPGALSRDELVAFLRYLSPVAVGLVGIALVTHVDILIVKAPLLWRRSGRIRCCVSRWSRRRGARWPVYVESGFESEVPSCQLTG